MHGAMELTEKGSFTADIAASTNGMEPVLPKIVRYPHKGFLYGEASHSIAGPPSY
jgi:hypothetical protein